MSPSAVANGVIAGRNDAARPTPFTYHRIYIEGKDGGELIAHCSLLLVIRGLGARSDVCLRAPSLIREEFAEHHGLLQRFLAGCCRPRAP